MDKKVDKLTVKDFASDQDVRWCPGCGDYAILKAVQKLLVDIEARSENTVFISGIGCAARFPYYIKSYGFHTIHGRAASVATGVKLANPELDIWVVSGDGDSLAIGGNHLLHVLRRNVDMQYLLINNEIYGLTKGQASPTSVKGLRTPSSPRGTIDSAVNACAFALGSGGKFISRSADIMQVHLKETLARAHAYKGLGFVEILQNCIVYNDGAFSHILGSKTESGNYLLLRHGEKMIFGEEDERKGLIFNSEKMILESVAIEDDSVLDSVLTHDEGNEFLASLLVRLREPYALGVIYCDSDAVSFERQFHDRSAPTKRGVKELEKLLRGGIHWKV